MKIASRFDEKYQLEKCPKCSMISQNFLIVTDVLFACTKCGTVFVPKYVRDMIDIKQLLDIQRECTCQYCGEISKSKAGKVSHERHCDKNPKKDAKS